MKQRLLVMNGQLLVQSEQVGQWGIEKVEKAGAVKPGIYNIYLATQADKGRVSDGPIIYADKDNVYQQVGKSFVKHSRKDFDKVPEMGCGASVSYENGRAIAAPSSTKLVRGIS
jgi:cell filamentation protein